MKFLYNWIKFVRSPHYFFLVTSLFFGSLFIFLVPPFQVPDEGSHFFRSIHIANGNIMGEKKNGTRLGGYLNTSIHNVCREFSYLVYNYESRINENKIKKLLLVNYINKPPIFVDFPNTAYYSPTAYLPQALAVWISKPLINRPLVLFYFTRICSFLFWATLIFFAIKIIPSHKWTFTFIALLPSSLFLHASCSADIVTNCFSFILIAVFLRLILVKEEIPNQFFFVVLLLLSSIILLNKVVYIPLIGLAFLIPTSKFSSLSAKFGWLFSLVIPCVILFAYWYFQTKSYFISYDNYDPTFREGLQINEGVNPAKQLAGIIEQPFTFLKVMFISFWESKSATLAHYFGKFGWEKNYIPTPIIFVLFIALLANALTENKDLKMSFTNAQRVFIFGIGLIMMLAFSMVMYMQWNPVGADRINNLSGRYFIPIFPLFFLALLNNKILVKSQKALQIGTCLLIWIALFSSTYSVLLRYWI